MMKRRRQERRLCILLANKEQLDLTVQVKATGQETLSHVSELLGIEDLHLFGLALLRDDEYLFIDLEQKLRKYFGNEWKRGSLTGTFVLFLRVQYFVESERLISSSREHQLYYTEMRQKVLRSQGHHQEALFFQLAAAALQADLGDLEQRQMGEEEGGDEEEEGQARGPEGEGNERSQKYRQYFLPEDYFPRWLVKRRGRDFVLQHSPALHRELRGLSQGQAILQFIKYATSLQDGPVTFYRMRQEKKERKSSILLGLAPRGVHVYEVGAEVEGKQSRLYDFCWTDIDQITFQGRRFEVHAIGSLCLSKLVYFTSTAFHSKHILRHLSDSHRFHMNTRHTVRHIQLLEDRRAAQSYREAYVCDQADLKRKLRSIAEESLASSMSKSDHSDAMALPTAMKRDCPREEEEHVIEVEQCVDEPEEVFVDNPEEISWLAELCHGVCADGSLLLPPSCWADITMEMKQVLNRRTQVSL